MPVDRYWARYAWLPPTMDGPADEPGRMAPDVLITVEDGRFSSVVENVAQIPSGVHRLDGVTLPGFANAHSHAFHRALRGRTQAGTGTFWTWRERMYAIAASLDPDTYETLARATFAEMALAGITCVGEFHYLHHAPDGSRYAEPNEIGHRLLAAAADAGIRITLLDTVYLTSTVDGGPLLGPQMRFGDGDIDTWSDRVSGIRSGPTSKIGAAAHSVRAVPAGVLADLARRAAGMPVHVHLSEQPAENAACFAVHGCTPTQLIERCGLVGDWVTTVHATHLTNRDRAILGDTRTSVCLCPTTERDLADGIGAARSMMDSAIPLCLGSDSHAVIDMFEEARAVELDERLATLTRGQVGAGSLIHAATAAGHAALGWTDAGIIAEGHRADLVTVGIDNVRLAGVDADCAAESIVYAANASDVRHVLVDGRRVVADGRHLLIDDVPRALADAVQVVWRRAVDTGSIR